MTDWARFVSKVDAQDGAACWLWQAARDRDGYGSFRSKRAHRIMYAEVFGAIPAGLTIDHLCRVRHCVNPWHLEAVTSRENIMRGEGLAAGNAAKASCPKGHSYVTQRLADGYRRCEPCWTARRH